VPLPTWAARADGARPSGESRVRPCGASEWPPCKAGAGGGRPSARATSHSPRGVLWSQASGEGGASAAASLRHPAFQERMAPRASEGMENVQPKTSNQRRSPAAARSPGGCRPGRLCVVQRVVRRVRVHLHASTRQQLRKRHHLLRASTSAPCRLCFAAARVGHRPCPGSARVVRATRCRDAEGSAARRRVPLAVADHLCSAVAREHPPEIQHCRNAPRYLICLSVWKPYCLLWLTGRPARKQPRRGESAGQRRKQVCLGERNVNRASALAKCGLKRSRLSAHGSGRPHLRGIILLRRAGFAIVATVLKTGDGVSQSTCCLREQRKRHAR